MSDAIAQTAGIYQTELVAGLQLWQLAWFAAIVWAAVTALRGNAPKAFGELAISVIVAGLGFIVVSDILRYLHHTDRVMSELSAAIITNTNTDPGVELRSQLHRAFVEQPYDAINWGGPLPGECAAARNEILVAGPHGADDKPREIMGDAGCKDQADFNARPTAARLYAAVLTLAASLGTVLLIGLVAATVMVARLLAAVCFAVAPLAAVAGIVPGPGRELCWRWVTSLARTVVAVATSTFVLSLLTVTTPVYAVANATVTTSIDSRCGRGVILTQPDGYQWIYCHASVLYVIAGQQVTAGQTVMLSGNTGNSTGPHLDLGLRTPGGVDLCPQALLTRWYQGRGIPPTAATPVAC